MPRAQKHPAQHRLALEKLQLEVALKRQKLRAVSPYKRKVGPLTRELKQIAAVGRANNRQRDLITAKTAMAVDSIALMQEKRRLTRLLKEEKEVTSTFLKEESERRGIEL